MKLLKQTKGNTLIMSPDSTKGYIGGQPHIHVMFGNMNSDKITIILVFYPDKPEIMNPGSLSFSNSETRSISLDIPSDINYNVKLGIIENMNLISIKLAESYLLSINPDNEFQLINMDVEKS